MMAAYVLPRVGKAGLGNQLFPWARAELFARRTGTQMLAPRWGEFSLGPYLRGEAEKRRYRGFFHAPHHVRGTTRFLITTFARRYSESENQTLQGDNWRPLLMEFSGINDLFVPLLGESAFVRNQLWNMTCAAHRPEGTEYGGRFVAMHIRRGDLTRQGFSPSVLEGVLQYTSTEWFVSMASALAAATHLRGLPLVIFTDGSAEEVRELTALPGVILHECRSALADLWLLSRAALLFASGYSTFSMWASYLGGMPTLYAPGKIQQRVQPGRDDAMEFELAAGECLPDAVIARLSMQTAQRN